MIFYWLSVAVRIVSTVVFPQNGYIHPDEFFQGPQIVFDDFFRANLTRSHEFRPDSALRSPSILYFLYGLPVFVVSKFVSPSFWSKLVFPRISIIFLGFLSDFVFFRSIRLFSPKIRDQKRREMFDFYSVSHVVLIFFTRTLSNCFESFLFVFLLFFVFFTVEKVQENRSTKFGAASIGSILSLAIFNRATFPAFALAPMIFFVLRLFSFARKSNNLPRIFGSIFVFLAGSFLVTSILLVGADSFYFNKRFVVAPLNFFLYNSNSNNLNEHGIHPRYLHFIVNGFLLFGPLHFYAVYLLVLKVFKRLNTKNLKISRRALAFYFVPFSLLSLIPHQEARFLIPCLFPLILLTAPVFDDRRVFNVFLIFNFLLALIFGHFHQAGLIPSLKFVENRSRELGENERLVLVSFHTYMPVDYLVKPLSNDRSTIKGEFKLIDLQGASNNELNRTIRNLFDHSSLNKLQVFLLLPAICRKNFQWAETNRRFDLIQQFGIHLDFDNPMTFHQRFQIENYRLELYNVL